MKSVYNIALIGDRANFLIEKDLLKSHLISKCEKMKVFVQENGIAVHQMYFATNHGHLNINVYNLGKKEQSNITVNVDAIICVCTIIEKWLYIIRDDFPKVPCVVYGQDKGNLKNANKFARQNKMEHVYCSYTHQASLIFKTRLRQMSKIFTGISDIQFNKSGKIKMINVPNVQDVPNVPAVQPVVNDKEPETCASSDPEVLASNDQESEKSNVALSDEQEVEETIRDITEHTSKFEEEPVKTQVTWIDIPGGGCIKTTLEFFATKGPMNK